MFPVERRRKVVQQIPILLLLLLLTLISSASGGIARERIPNLRSGMSYSEVLTLAGSPKEKKVMESKRAELWHYGKYEVRFLGGRVVDFQIGRETGIRQAADKQFIRSTASPRIYSERRNKEKEVSVPPDLMRKILKGLPSASQAPDQMPNMGVPSAPPLPNARPLSDLNVE